MTARRLAHHGAFFLVAILALAACGSAGGVPRQQAAAASPPPTVPPLVIPDAFRGTWTADIDAGPMSTGTWKLRITARNMELLNPRAKSEDEFFSLNPRTAGETGLTLFADPDCDAADYQWSIGGGSLTFEAVEDTCGDRRATLTTTAWERSP